MRRYRCRPRDGAAHRFSLLVTPAGEMGPQWSPPPPCPRHPGSRVTRNGTYGTRTAKPRQRYRCVPNDGTAAHSFTPPLARDHVHVGGQQCDECDELRGIHHGDYAVARQHTWPARIVARALADLAAGRSYGDVSLWALRAAGRQHSALDAGAASESEDPTSSVASKKNPGTAAANNAWHIAADWVEAFSPVVYEPLDAGLREQALEERARLDRLRERGVALDTPQVWLLDDVPVYGRRYGQKRSRRDDGFFILVIAEWDWSGVDPAELHFTAGTLGKPRLRLVRAMPKSNHLAWRLLFDELGYTPDFVIADAGTGIRKAVEDHFDPARTHFVPSLWHVRRAIAQALEGVPGATVLTTEGKRLRAELAAPLGQLARDGDAVVDAAGWRDWWTELERACAALSLPVDKVRTRRSLYEEPFAEAIGMLASHPAVPRSTGGLETLIAKHVEPLLARRRTGFANIERTNSLFDLVVAREHGVFDNLTQVARLLRDDALRHDGHAVSLRAVSDPRPPGGRYSSLRDTTLLAEVAKQRGIT